MALQFTVRDVNGNVTLDLTKSLTKIIGSITVNSSRTVNIPELNGKRGWVMVRGVSWTPNGTPKICSANLKSNGDIEIRVSAGTFEIFYGIY